jgi:glucokinase
MILAGDIGGTSCRLIACDERGHKLCQRDYSSKAFGSFTEVLQAFLAEHEYAGADFAVACFGLPGPVLQQRCRLTNLRWIVDAAELAAETGICRVLLLNDLQATAYGLSTLCPEEFLTLNAGEPAPEGNQVIVAPGTGLGEAAVTYVHGQPVAIATEGGHTDFGPTTELEIELLRHVQKKAPHGGAVTYETLISGPGLLYIHDFLRSRSGEPTPAWLAEEMRDGDPSAKISAAGLALREPICVQTLDVFVEILASECANMALKFLATGGVFLGGGIPPRIRRKLEEPRFLRRFTSKDALSWLLPKIPVKVILNDQAGRQGAVAYALRALRA